MLGGAIWAVAWYELIKSRSDFDNRLSERVKIDKHLHWNFGVYECYLYKNVSIYWDCNNQWFRFVIFKWHIFKWPSSLKQYRNKNLHKMCDHDACWNIFHRFLRGWHLSTYWRPKLVALFNPSVPYCRILHVWFQEALNWAPMMPKGAINALVEMTSPPPPERKHLW